MPWRAVRDAPAPRSGGLAVAPGTGLCFICKGLWMKNLARVRGAGRAVYFRNAAFRSHSRLFLSLEEVS